MNLLTGASFQRLEGAVKAAEMRQSVLSNNIANEDTPNFKRSEVVFEQLLEQEMGKNGTNDLRGNRTNEKHIPINGSSSIPTAKILTEQLTTINNNENNVDIDREMSLLAKNQLSYNFYVNQINHDVSMLRIGIEGRG
ncbi:MAG: flagellar basal body rod protein FlgB [Candidatus Pristimantibacillus sp.]